MLQVAELQSMYSGVLPPSLFGAPARTGFSAGGSEAGGGDEGGGGGCCFGWEDAVKALNEMDKRQLPTAKLEAMQVTRAAVPRRPPRSASHTYAARSVALSLTLDMSLSAAPPWLATLIRSRLSERCSRSSYWAHLQLKGVRYLTLALIPRTAAPLTGWTASGRSARG